MDAKSFKFQILKGSLARRVFFRTVMLASAISVVSLLRAFSAFDLTLSLAPAAYIDCAAAAGSDSEPPRFANNATLSRGFKSRVLTTLWSPFQSCQRDANVTVNVVTELTAKHLIDIGAKTLCIGEGSLTAVTAMKQMGFPAVTGAHSHRRLFSLMQKKTVYELDYEDSSFDFVFSRDLDKVSVPALLVLEVERVLRPGGVGALLVGSTTSNPNDLIRSATPVSSLLRSSAVVHVGSVNHLNLVVFRKRSDNASRTFYPYPLPADCPSISFTKPLIELMEPLLDQKPHPDQKKMIPYLPKFVDVSKRKRLVYIDIGVGELLNANASDWFLPNYPIDQKEFNVYFVHYNTSIMLSYVKRPGVTFVYHPGLAGKVSANGDDGDLDPFVGEEEFDFAAWFKETVQYADFVVLKMNAGKVEIKFLWDIFDSGAICFVDELFLRCPEESGSCMDIYNGLRGNGVYAHQWWGGG